MSCFKQIKKYTKTIKEQCFFLSWFNLNIAEEECLVEIIKRGISNKHLKLLINPGFDLYQIELLNQAIKKGLDDQVLQEMANQNNDALKMYEYLRNHE